MVIVTNITTWSSYWETDTAWYTALPCSLFSSSKALLAESQKIPIDHSPIIIEHVHKISDGFLEISSQKDPKSTFLVFVFSYVPMVLHAVKPGGHPNGGLVPRRSSNRWTTSVGSCEVLGMTWSDLGFLLRGNSFGGWNFYPKKSLRMISEYKWYLYGFHIARVFLKGITWWVFQVRNLLFQGSIFRDHVSFRKGAFLRN